MSNPEIVVPSDISQILNERSNTWKQFDQAQNQLAELEKRASQIVVSSFAQIPAELTSEKTPPAEVAAAYQNFQAEMARIAKAQEDIATHQAEVKKVKGQRTRMMILIGLGVIILLGLLAFGGYTILLNLQR